MLQRGTVVTKRSRPLSLPTLACVGVIVGSENGIPMIKLTNGEGCVYNSKDWKITSDSGGEDLLDSAINDQDKAQIDFMNTMTSMSIIALHNALEDSDIEMNNLSRFLSQKQEQLRKMNLRLTDNQAQLTDCRRRLDEAYAQINPLTRFRVSIGTKENADVTEILPITEAAANDIAEKLSGSIRRQVIVEHIRHGVTVYATLWKGGKQVS